MRDAELNEIIFNVLISRIRRESHCTGSMKIRAVKKLIKAAKSVFEAEEIQLKLAGDFIVVGDLHGNIDDLLQIFETFNYPPNQKYVFLGDYIDRGHNSIDVLLLLYSLKLKYPQHIYLLRGNHESKRLSTSYGFKDECLCFLSKRCYNLFVKSFNYLPIAAILNDKIFCVHGGLSPSISYLSEIDKLQKPVSDVSNSIAADLLWSDPSSEIDHFKVSPRGSGYLFGADIVDQFLADNELKLIIRAHEFCQDGYRYTLDNCLTIFSANDYQNKLNESAVAIVTGSDVEISVHIHTFKKNLLFSSIDHLMSFPEWIFSETNPMKPVIPQVTAEVTSEFFSDVSSLTEQIIFA